MNYQKKPYPNIGHSFLLLVILIGFTIATYLLMLVIFIATGTEMDGGEPVAPILKSVNTAVVYTLSGILTVFVGFRLRKASDIKEKIGTKKVPLLIYIGAMVVTLCFGFMEDIITYAFPMPEFIKDMFGEMGRKDIYTFLTVVVVAPVLEELLFRGVILDGFLKRYNANKSILVSAFLFGLIHFIPWQAFPAFLIGIFLGWLYWRTRSIILCIFLHAFNNLMATLVYWNIGSQDSPFVNMMGIQNYLIGFIIALLIIIGVVRLMHKRLPKIESEDTENTIGDLPL